MNSKPNLLLIVTDQQSASMMGCANNPYVNTPNLDWLASGGVRFEHAYCANPVCVPSRFCLLTGRYPSEIEMWHNDSETVDPKKAAVHYGQGMGWLLRDAGYETVYAGKQHLPCGTAEDAGFKVLDKDERDRLGETCADYLKQEHDKPFAMVASFINPHDICYMAIRDSVGTDFETEQVRRAVSYGEVELSCLDEALKIPEGMSEDEFFATVCPPLPDNHLPQQDEAQGVSDQINLRPFKQHARSHYTERDWRMHRWAYAKLTELVDRQIGVVLDALRATGRDRDTMVIFTSDHGDHDSSHMLEHKTIPYREAAVIPFIVRPPSGMEQPKVDSENLICNGLDILPTLCDYAGARVPDDLMGKSLRPLLEEKDGVEWRKSLRIESQNSVSINTRDWQYTVFEDGANREQLYDLRNDPGQTRNHAFDPENAEVLERHKKLFEEDGAPVPALS